ncbi:MAG: hypothetical protein JWM18_422 [Chloroflexi bacterium]|jgi:hypothetical protein|nr:hypothetical protein [Chloroflexota bacterium]
MALITVVEEQVDCLQGSAPGASGAVREGHDSLCPVAAPCSAGAAHTAA